MLPMQTFDRRQTPPPPSPAPLVLRDHSATQSMRRRRPLPLPPKNAPRGWPASPAAHSISPPSLPTFLPSLPRALLSSLPSSHFDFHFLRISPKLGMQNAPRAIPGFSSVIFPLLLRFTIDQTLFVIDFSSALPNGDCRLTMIYGSARSLVSRVCPVESELLTTGI